MMVTEIGKQMAKSGGVGLARPVMEQMLRMQETRESASPVQGLQAQAPAGQTSLERSPRLTTSQPSPSRRGR
jgi:Rod binding domain-containing protein